MGLSLLPDVRVVLFALGLHGIFALWIRAEDASQFLASPPDVYGQKMAALLTSVDDVLKKHAEYDQLQGDGIVLADEVVSYVTADGHRIVAYHTLTKATDDSGVQQLAQDTFTFKKKYQKVYLVLAQTIQPDGTRNPVKSDAVFYRTPPDQADASVYDDQAEMVTIYPNVKPGTLTENITVVEDVRSRIPNEYLQTLNWQSGWPEYLQRLVVNLPDSYAKRLKINYLGSNVPASTSNPTEPNRQQWTWEKINTPALVKINGDPPADQVGPSVRLTTLSDWNAFAAWYNGLIKGTDDLTPAFKTSIDAWTKDAKGPADILALLYRHVARDVRYTAFELGDSDFQPHDCMSVWNQQYGDCKDKANLLRAMLNYKNVPARLVLLNTKHAGTVDKASPDYRQFNHCIVAAEIDGTRIFCDPTLKYGAPGILSGAESDRDVMVINGTQGEWGHTTPFQGASETYSFDLQLKPNGELAGWMTIYSTGYYAANDRETFKDLSKQQTINTLRDDARGIFPNSEVADVDTKDPADDAKPSAAPAPFSIRGYMVLTGVLAQGDGPTQLKFPAPGILLPDITDYQTRHFDMFTWPDRQEIACHIALPAPWTAPKLPDPLVYNSPSAIYRAAWTQEGSTLSTDCTVELKHSLYPPSQMQDLGSALTNLKSWASQTLALTRSTATPVAAVSAPSDDALAANLAVMPTGDGQLNLIDTEFPRDGNLNARRAALRRVSVLFPSDSKAIVYAAIELGVLDLDDNKPSKVLGHLQPVSIPIAPRWMR